MIFFRHVVGGCGFTGKDEDARLPVEIRVFQDFVVAVDDVHQIQCLAFVFVDAFDLNVKQRVRVYFDAQFGFNVFGEAFFGSFFHGTKFCLYFRIVYFFIELGQVVQMQTPVLFAQMFVEETGQLGVGNVDPAARGYAVGLRW